MPAYRVRRWSTGIGLTGAAIIAAMIGMTTAHADPSDDNAPSEWSIVAHDLLAGSTATPDDLLNSAITNLTDANNVLSGAEVTGNSDLTQFVASQTTLQDKLLQLLGQLESAESTISSHDGSFSDLVNQLFFTPLDQQWATATESVLNADQFVETDVAGGAIPEAEALILGVHAADLLFPGLSFGSDFVDVVAGSF
ncbi:MAG: hypothetical protein ACRDTN_09450 [Mycobacterium sp.]